jgi:hypothetical protein
LNKQATSDCLFLFIVFTLRDTGYWMLDAGCWILNAGYGIRIDIHMKKIPVILLVVFFPTLLPGQNTKRILIETKNTCIALTVGNNQRLVQSYIGKKLSATEYEELKGGNEVYLTAGM